MKRFGVLVVLFSFICMAFYACSTKKVTQGTTNVRPKMGDIVRYAVEAGRRTGVAPEILLAVSYQETGYLQNTGRHGGFNNAISSADRAMFIVMARRHGIDYLTARAGGCAEIGYGQFRSTTFAQISGYTWKRTADGGYRYKYHRSKDRVARALGEHGPHNPWDPRINFIAMGLYLRDLKVNERGGPWKAFVRYNAGPTRADQPWTEGYRKGSRYADGVLAKIPGAKRDLRRFGW